MINTTETLLSFNYRITLHEPLADVGQDPTIAVSPDGDALPAGWHDPPIECQERGAVRVRDCEQIGVRYLLMPKNVTEEARCMGQCRQGFQIDVSLIAG